MVCFTRGFDLALPLFRVPVLDDLCFPDNRGRVFLRPRVSIALRRIAGEALEPVGLTDVGQLVLREDDPAGAVVDRVEAVWLVHEEHLSGLVVDDRRLLLEDFHAVQDVPVLEDDDLGVGGEGGEDDGQGQRRDRPGVE
jgi:hypothetical protein